MDPRDLVTTMTETREPKKKGIPRGELEQQYPSLTYLTGPATPATKRSWVAVFKAKPDAMHNLLADYIKQVYAVPGRIGQRPMPEEQRVDFAGLLYAEENELPIGQVLRRIVSDSQRVFAAKVHMSRGTYERLLAGRYDPDVNEIRLIAKALRRPPTFFVEYRKAMVVAAVLNMLEERPGLATTIYKQYLEIRMKN